MDPQYGPPIWTSTMDPHYRPPIWTPILDPHFGPILWTAKMDPQYGPPIWTPNMDPQYGPSLWTANMYGPQFGTPIWDPNLESRFGTLIFLGGASPGSAGCFKKPTQIPYAGHPICMTRAYVYFSVHLFVWRQPKRQIHSPLALVCCWVASIYNL
jgi:hypothetical protein